jgi:ribosome-associated protein
MSEIPEEDEKILKCICQTLFDKKGFNILSLDVRGLSTLTDYYVIAEGNVEKHVQALARDCVDALLDLGIRPRALEGQAIGDWVVIDCTDVVVHLFVPEMREKYALEQLWQKAAVVDVPIQLHKA